MQKCYLELFKLLPIGGLVERLYLRDLLSIDRKSKFDGLTSPEENYFLDEMLIPAGLNIGYTGHFEEMVNLMKKSDDILSRELVEKLILHVLDAGPDVTVDVGASTSTATNAGIDEVASVGENFACIKYYKQNVFK